MILPFKFPNKRLAKAFAALGSAEGYLSEFYEVPEGGDILGAAWPDLCRFFKDKFKIDARIWAENDRVEFEIATIDAPIDGHPYIVQGTEDDFKIARKECLWELIWAADLVISCREEKVTTTKSEIAEKFNVDVDQLIIKD